MRKQSKFRTKRHAKRASVKAIKPNDEKFRELLLFIAERSEKDPRFGAIKINKLLFYCDFLAYLKLGKPITGQEYFALEQGPAPRYGTRIREQMTADHEIAVQRKETMSGVQARVVALRDADTTVFTSQEVALITHVLQVYRGSSGTELSELSHKFAGWQWANEKETIPYEVALVGYRPPTRSEVQRGAALVATAAECLSEHAAGTA